TLVHGCLLVVNFVCSRLALPRLKGVQMMNLRVVAAGLVFGMLGASSIANAEQVFRARLSGGNEVPSVTTDSAGRFQILVNNDATAGQYTLRVDSGIRITQSHFHCGAAGVNGPVIVFIAGFRPEG